jgi:hypothetical protein
VKTIRRALETCGVDDITVFPDLEGLSRTVERRWKEELKRLPHQGVATRLARSRTHGVGVFVITTIKKGTKLFPHDVDEMIWLKKDELGNCQSEFDNSTRISQC